jgi:transposase InsO family protein
MREEVQEKQVNPALFLRPPQRLAHLEWWRAYSHFVRPHALL